LKVVGPAAAAAYTTTTATSVVIMPPKSAPSTSKKTEQKKKVQRIEDQTFGLKNKNKSKKVQQHIESVTKSVLHSGDRRQRQLEEQRKQAKAAAKVRKKAEEAERDALFGEALLAVSKKKTTNLQDGKVEAKGRDADDDEKKSKGTSRAMKMMYQMDAKEMEERLKEDVRSSSLGHSFLVVAVAWLWLSFVVLFVFECVARIMGDRRPLQILRYQLFQCDCVFFLISFVGGGCP
jgi:hypothetical protein